MMSFRRGLMARFANAGSLVACVVAVCASSPASAGDIQGDAYSCAELRQLRNRIYRRAGYCFKSGWAIAEYGRAGCRFSSESAVPLSQQDRIELRDIRRSEKRQGC